MGAGVPASPVSAGAASPGPRSTSDQPGPRSIAPSKLGLVEAASGMRDETEVDVKGKRKVVVETSAVRDALRLLDGTPAHSEDGEELREYKRARVV